MKSESYLPRTMILITLLSFLSINISAQAQKLSSENQDYGGHSFILKNLYDDFTYLMFEPDFYSVVGGIAVSPYVFQESFDKETPSMTEKLSSQSADNFFELGEILGGGTFQVSASAAIYSSGLIFGNSRIERFGSHLLRAHAINGLFTAGLKIGINRTRPNGHTYSYPSGHTSSAFTTAGVIYNDLGPKWGIPAYLVASYVGISRLQENAHYFSDVVAGAVLGTYISYKITHRDIRSRGFALKPTVIDGSPGARVSVKF